MIINRYIFRNILERCIFLTGIVCVIIIMMNSIKLLEFLVSRSINGLEFLEMLTYLVPQYIVMILPFTLFIATLNTYNGLLQTRELTILHSVGKSPIQLLTPAVYAGIVCSAVSLVGHGYFMPEGWHKFQQKRYAVSQKSLLSKQIIAGKFQDIGHGNILFVESVSSTYIKNIFIFKKSDNTILTATEGKILESDNATTLILKNGTQQSNLTSLTSPPIISFDKYTVTFDVAFSKYVGKQKHDELNNVELVYLIHILKNTTQYWAELLRRLLDSLYPLILSLMGALTILYKPATRLDTHRYTLYGTATMIGFMGITMSMSTKVRDGVHYLYYNGVFVLIVCVGIAGFILLKTNVYTWKRGR